MIQLLIDGIPFNPPSGKEISESTPYTLMPIGGGIKVDWGNLGEEIIEGTSSDATQGSGWTEVWRSFPPVQFTCVGNIIRGYSKNFLTGGSYKSFRIDANSGEIIRSTVIQTTIRTLRVEYHTGEVTPTCRGKTFSSPTSRLQSISNSGSLSNLSSHPMGTLGWTIYGVERLLSNWYKITSNVGDISFRETNSPPAVSLISSGCEIIVNYSDGSQSPIMKFSPCPEIEIVHFEECPCVCPSTLSLADSVISLLGTF